MGKETRTVVINSERVGLAFLFYATGQSTLKVLTGRLAASPDHFNAHYHGQHERLYNHYFFIFPFEVVKVHLLVCKAESAQSSAIYPYFICLGWRTKCADCRQKGVLIKTPNGP